MTRPGREAGERLELLENWAGDLSEIIAFLEEVAELAGGPDGRYLRSKASRLVIPRYRRLRDLQSRRKRLADELR